MAGAGLTAVTVPDKPRFATPRSLKLAEAGVLVREAPTAAAESYATGHWPETGAVAGVPAGFTIQVC